MPTVVKTSARCAIFELALRFAHRLNMALIPRHFLSLIIYVCAWIPTAPKNTLGNTYSCSQHVAAFPSTLFLLCYQREMWESTLGLCATTQVETSAISLRKSFILTGSPAEDHHSLVFWDLTIWTGNLPGRCCMFWVLFPQEEEGVRREIREGDTHPRQKASMHTEIDCCRYS